MAVMVTKSTLLRPIALASWASKPFFTLGCCSSSVVMSAASGKAKETETLMTDLVSSISIGGAGAGAGALASVEGDGAVVGGVVVVGVVEVVGLGALAIVVGGDGAVVEGVVMVGVGVGLVVEDGEGDSTAVPAVNGEGDSTAVNEDEEGVGAGVGAGVGTATTVTLL